VPRPYRTSLTPEQRKERARQAAAARHSPDAYIDTLMRRAPKLTSEQITKLRTVLAKAEGRA